MLLVDSLIVLGMATVSLGTIHEADGVQERSFWLKNCGSGAVAMVQGYTSCGCTTIHFAKDEAIAPGDSTCVTLRFNPRGKGGEFEETGTLVYGSQRRRLQLSLIGNCIASEETLMRQFPIRINDSLRLSANRFDLGIMQVGQKKERNVIVLHCDEHNRQERIPIVFKADANYGKGLMHIDHPIIIMEKGRQLKITVTFDVIIK